MPNSSSRGIYLSYRREDGGYTRILNDQLRERIPDADILADLDSLTVGQSFAEAIRDAVQSCAVFVAVIGPRWATLADEEGHRRLDNPDDFVRWEIQAALGRGMRVIPVLVEGARMPREQELPSGLKGIARLNAFELRSDSHFADDANRLVQLIERALDEAPDVGRSATAGPSVTSHGISWLRGARAREGRSVFISYRRRLSESLALLVRKDLIEHRFNAFVDLENLDSGEFDRRILSQIEAREHFIVLLEPGSLDRTSQDGDWLRREIAHALAHGRNVVPVTAKGFEFRRDLVLPPDVARLPSFNAVPIPPGYFDAAMERLRERFLKMPSNPTSHP